MFCSSIISLELSCDCWCWYEYRYSACIYIFQSIFAIFHRKQWKRMEQFQCFLLFFATISHPFSSLAARSRSTGFSVYQHSGIRCVCGSICFNCNLKYAAKAIVWNTFFLSHSRSPPFGFRLSHCSSAIVHMLIVKHFPSEKYSFSLPILFSASFAGVREASPDAFAWKLF